MAKKLKKIPELLAPAGNLLAGITAFEAGADAVYAGLNKFNARERSENFSIKDMSSLIAHAHKNSKKVYITLNTLIKENELPEVVENLAELGRIRPDAIIVQDLGVLKIIREYFPDLEIHASTQMGFHNSAGLNVASDLGVKRVILERQVTLDEIKSMQKNSPVELEIFVHGALCASLSGQCLFSSWLGGWSGNRGKCKQPCRRRFFSNKGNGFFFSTQDLSTLDLVHEFKEMGLASLKIEGRLRKPDYIHNAVAAYRLLLDAEDKPDRKLLGEARKILSGTYGRKWSHGFYSDKSIKTLIKHDTPGAAGLLCGKVDICEENGFGFRTANRLYLGDRLRVQPSTGDEGPSLTVTRMSVEGRSTMKATSGQECFIFCDKEIPMNGLVYKIGENYDEMQNKLTNLPELRSSLDLRILLNSKEIEIEVLNADCENWKKSINLQPAKNQPLRASKVVSEFTASRSEDMQAGTIHVDLGGDYFVPASELKSIRREFWEWAVNNIPNESIFNANLIAMDNFRKDYMKIKKTRVKAANLPETIVMGAKTKLPANRKAIKAYPIFDTCKMTEEVILPAFCAEKYLGSLKKMIKSAYERRIRRFRITGLYALDLLKEYENIHIIVGYPFPVCNSMTVMELADLGAEKVQGWLELERDALEELNSKSVLPLEIYRYGRPALLATRAYVSVKGDVKDSRSNRFVVKEDNRTHIVSIYPKSVFSIPRLPETADYYDLTNANWGAREIESFNFENSLL